MRINSRNRKKDDKRRKKRDSKVWTNWSNSIARFAITVRISLDYPVCTARKQTFYYKRFLLDWFFIIMLRLLRDKCQPHKENKSTFRSLYLHASSSWRGKSDLLKYLKYCPCTCRQSEQDDNINAIKTLFPLWLFNIAFLKTIYIMQSQMPSGHLLLSCVKMAATAKISSFAYLR